MGVYQSLNNLCKADTRKRKDLISPPNGLLSVWQKMIVYQVRAVFYFASKPEWEDKLFGVCWALFCKKTDDQLAFFMLFKFTS